MYESLSSGAKALLARLTKIKEIPGITKREVKEGKFEMCKAFEDMRLEGIREGRQEGIKEGIREGRQEGIKEGIREGERRAEERMCKAFILKNLDEKKDEQAIIEKLMKYFSLDSESAGRYFQMYAGNMN